MPRKSSTLRVQRGRLAARGGGRYQQIDGPEAARLAPGRDDRRVNASVGSGRVAIERQWTETPGTKLVHYYASSGDVSGFIRSNGARHCDLDIPIALSPPPTRRSSPRGYCTPRRSGRVSRWRCPQTRRS